MSIRKPYEKPIIRKLQTGTLNKFGASPQYMRQVRPALEGVPIEELVTRFGSPLFVFSERTLREQYRTVYQAFASRYPRVTMGWSYKTNYLKAICAILHTEGAWAEVVSEMEYEKARGLGIPGHRILYNGPHKTRRSLAWAIREGARIHIDHWDELQELETLAEEEGKEIPVAIRLNMDTGIYPQWTRFGFNLESGQAMDVVRRMQAGGKLRLQGLHCHIGTFILEPAAYAREVAKMVQFAYEIKEQTGWSIEYLDIGGGFPSRNRLKGIYLPPDVAIPPIDAYAEAVTDALYDSLQPGDFPELVLETGRAIVDEAGWLITTVEAAKRLPDGRRAYVLDAGVNLLYTSTWYRFTIALDREVPGMNEPSLLVGPLCMNIDVIDEAAMLPPLKRGVRLILSPVGAYNVTQWMQFIEYRPAVVLIGQDGSVALIREAEELTDIERRERLPEWLKYGEDAS